MAGLLMESLKAYLITNSILLTFTFLDCSKQAQVQLTDSQGLRQLFLTVFFPWTSATHMTLTVSLYF